MPLTFKSEEELSKLSPGKLAVAQTIISQDLAISLEQVNQNINDINTLRLKTMVEQKQASPVPPVSIELKSLTDNFTQAVCNTYRVEIKPLFTPIETIGQPKN
jgi:hypothetical protein